MARQYAKFKTDMWRLDDDLRALPREAQHLYFVLTTGPELSLAGVTDWRPNRIAKLAHGWTRKQVADAAAILADRLFILLDEDTEEVLIRTFIKHDELLRSHTTAAGVVTAWGSIYSPRLRGAVADEVSKLAAMGLPDRVVRAIAPILDYPSEGVSHGVSDGVSDTPNDGPTRQTANSRQQTADDASAPRFADFWAAYPKKASKGAAEKAWTRATKKADPGSLIAAASAYALSVTDSDPRFTKHPATWLNQECWLDDMALDLPTPTRQETPPPDYANIPDAVTMTPERFAQLMAEARA